jgi:GNAT superfamily N-acetyltransferase
MLNLAERDCVNRVGWFFRDEAERLGWWPMLFDSDRWSQCDEAIVAEENGEIVGVVTLASRGIQESELPTVDALYVVKKRRRTGLGHALFEKGLRRLMERGAGDKIFCQLQSSIMLHLIAKLPDDLKNNLQVLEAFQYGDLAEDFE